MNIHGWDHFDLEKEIGNSNMAQLLALFQRETEKYKVECVRYATEKSDLTREAYQSLKKRCEHLSECRMKVALVIAERMTDATLIQHEVRPSNR